MQKIRGFVVLLLFLIIGVKSYSQIHQWAKSVHSKSHGYPNAVDLDSNHNTYSVGHFMDTLRIDNKTIVAKSRNNTNDIFIAKFNEDGKVIWCKSIYIKSSGTQTLNSHNIKVLSNKRIMVYGYFNSTGVLMLGPRDSIVNSSKTVYGTGFIAIYDSSGNVTEHLKVFEGNGIVTQINGQIDIDRQNNIYLTCRLGNGTIYSKRNNVTISTSAAVSKIVKFKQGFDSVLWCKDLSNSNYFFIAKIRSGTDNNLYIASLLMGDKQTINKINYSFPKNFCKAFLIILSPSGNFIHSGLINSDTNQQDNVFDVTAHDTNRIYVTGYVKDSILRGGIWYRSANRGSRGSAFPYIGLINTSNGAKWINLTRDKDSIFNSSYFQSGLVGRLNFDKAGNVYSSFQQYYNKLISIGGLTDTNRYNVGFAKFDSLGNALWLRSASFIFDIQNDDKSLIYCGVYSGKVFLKPFTLRSSSNYSGFIAKTQDYTITRGNVFGGPYCAGDTIRVPYTKIGDFDTSNIFIAELSDENGNFEGKENELGRLKTNRDSVVVGKLPLFKVASSGKYRIRIRSTNPVVQSFYKLDSLRLLIYSRDKADPGPTETICFGDSIQLNTYGGTKWIWSPKYNMNDSGSRQPIVWPKVNTTYKIIIGDSSGCGAPDTAYKKIILRKPLKVALAFNNTIVCDSSLLKIPVQFFGGDSTNYHWQWYHVIAIKSWKQLNSGKLKLNDTLFHIPKVNFITSQKLALVLSDECTNKTDTAFLTISLLKPSEIETKFKDTLLCAGNPIRWKSQPVYGLSKNYQWQWRDITNKIVLSNSDSLNLIAKKTITIQLTLSNGCTTDSNTFTLFVNPPLEADILTAKGILRDTTLCFGQSLQLFSKGKGGQGSGYKYSWSINGIALSGLDTLLFQSDVLFPAKGGIKTMTLTLKDNCTKWADSISKIITVIESPKADFSYGTICDRKNADFKFMGYKPQAPVSTSFYWDFEAGGTSVIENPSILLNTTGVKKITLKLTSDNGCKDEIIKNIDVKPQSKADFDVKDVCENDSARFVNKSSVSKGNLIFRWNFGDGNSSYSKSPGHLYSISTNSKTFDVKLVAIVTDGCSDSITKTITVIEAPEAAFSYGPICDLTKTDFKFTGTKPKAPVSTTFNWEFEGAGSSVIENPSVLLNTTGNKKITLTLNSDNGCKDEISADVIVKPQSKAGFKVNDVCENDSARFINQSTVSTGNLNYRWTFGDGQKSFAQSPGHLYNIGGVSKTYNVKLVAIVQDGCSDSITNAISVSANPVSTFTFTTSGRQVNFKADQITATLYKWRFGDGGIDSTTNANYNYNYLKFPSGKYTACLTVINADGCTSESCKEVWISGGGVNNLINQNGIEIFPNPNSGNFTIIIEEPKEELSIEIYNPVGELVKIVDTTQNKSRYTIDLNLSAGIYLVKVMNEGLVFNQKVIVTK